MYTRETRICNQTGLHARPASVFMEHAKGFRSKIRIGRVGAAGQQANAKSILMVLSLALTQGTDVILTAEGEDERDAVDTLVSLIESGFGEL